MDASNRTPARVQVSFRLESEHSEQIEAIADFLQITKTLLVDTIFSNFLRDFKTPSGSSAADLAKARRDLESERIQLFAQLKLPQRSPDSSNTTKP